MSAAAPAQVIAIQSKRRTAEIAPPDRMDDDAYLGQFIPLHYHGQMLSDERRLSAFHEAIEKLVPEGSHVVELGGGTGVLSFFASKRARKVSCIERIPHVAAAARRLIEMNGASHKVTVFEGDARTFVPDEAADVVICDMLHAGLVRDKQIAVLEDFKARHEAHFGRPIPIIIPEATILAVQPVFQPFEFGGYVAPVPMFFQAGVSGTSTVELGSPEVYAIVEYARETPVDFVFDRLMTVDSTGTINALRFITKNVVGIFPKEGRSSDWHMNYMTIPLPQPIQVTAGERIRVRFQYEAGASMQSLGNAISATPWRRR
jgi:predicted RNA methylase